MDITFNCDKCGQSIVIGELGAGRQVECPKCGTSLSVPTSGGGKARTTQPNGLPVSNGTIDPQKIAELEIGRFVRLRLHDGTELQWPSRGGVSVWNGKLYDGLKCDWRHLLEGTRRRKDGSEYTIRRCPQCGKTTIDRIGLCASCEYQTKRESEEGNGRK